MAQKIANINNLSYIAVALEKLVNRQDGLPAFGVYYGPSGYGKTTTTIAVAQETRAHYIEMCSVWSKKAFAEKICIEIGVKPAKTVSGCLDLIAKQLGASQRTLIIDEADYAAQKPDLIAFIRDIHQVSKSPILLIGEEDLPFKLKKYERVHQRVLAWVAAQPVSIDDALMLAEIYAPDLKIADDLLKHIVEMAHGSVRLVTVNLVNVKEAALTKGLEVIGKDDVDLPRLNTGEAPRRLGRV